MSSQFLTRREQRILAKEAVEQDWMMNAQRTADSGMMNASRELQMLQEQVAMERQQAVYDFQKKALMEESEALKMLTDFNPAKPNSDVELMAIRAKFPAAMKASPIVKQLFEDRFEGAKETKKFESVYSEALGGAKVPVTESGEYDMPRARTRMFQNQQLNQALSVGAINPDEYKSWMSMEETAFQQAFAPTMARRGYDDSVLKAGAKNRDANIDKNLTMFDAGLKHANTLKPGDNVLPGTPEYTQAQDAYKKAVNTAQGYYSRAAELSGQRMTAPGTPAPDAEATVGQWASAAKGDNAPAASQGTAQDYVTRAKAATTEQP